MDDANRRRHIFGNPRHNLDVLVRQYGSEEAAGQAIADAVNAELRIGGLIVDDRGYYKQVVRIGGNSVTVSGRVVNGNARVGTAWISS